MPHHPEELALRRAALQGDDLAWSILADWYEDRGQHARACRARRGKPDIPDVIHRFRDYHERPGNGTWGSLHIVLDDGNTEDHCVEFCARWASERGDVEGYALARILSRMSPTQRGRIPSVIRRLWPWAL